MTPASVVSGSSCGVVAEDGVEDFALHPNRIFDVVELRQHAVEEVRRERNRVVRVVVAVDDVTDVVERRGEGDDDAFVGFVQSFVRRAVELDAAAFQQVVEEKRAISNDFDVFSPVVVVSFASDRVDVLGVKICLNLLVVCDEFEYLVQFFVGKGVVCLRVVGTPPVLGLLIFRWFRIHAPHVLVLEGKTLGERRRRCLLRSEGSTRRNARDPQRRHPRSRVVQTRPCPY